MNTHCLCGCGQQTLKGRSFLQGHWSRTPAAKLIKHGPSPRPINDPNPDGVCFCGCGQSVPVVTSDHPERGIRAGHHRRYITGHHTPKGAKNHGWKGGRMVASSGYIYVRMPQHPAATKDGYMFEHRLVAEKRLGRYLLKSERVHHIDGDKTNNADDNLVVIRNQAEHTREPGHGVDALRKWRAENPEAALKNSREAGRKGAAAKWGKH